MAITDASGGAVAGIEVSEIRTVNLGFNTTGEAAEGRVGDLFFDYTDDARPTSSRSRRISISA